MLEKVENFGNDKLRIASNISKSQHEGKSTEKDHDKDEDKTSLIGALTAEIVGTFALTLVAAGTIVLGKITEQKVDYTAQNVAPGLVVMAMIYAIGEASGAHLNPVVTLAFAIRRDFPFYKVPLYWLAQFIGALLAGFLLRISFGVVEDLGTTKPHTSDASAFVFEVVLTIFLVLVILGTSNRYRVVGPNAALAVGGTLAFCSLLGGAVSGASMNPFRSLGPAIAAGTLENMWIYVLAPLLGGLIAVALAWLLFGGRKSGEKEAAQGKKGQQSS